METFFYLMERHIVVTLSQPYFDADIKTFFSL